ncbi:evolutionarily conserved C-terminal region 11 [Striga asiatica]|uniref:Evolutionarily conserved C-terminal region 11 n=1 Tax=Striga asiatica TaxID=4170 RepID=A0A5A7Q062_STRAF|nr:evolutionarily conserved C-terminal region 11 [Striga asiatica]
MVMAVIELDDKDGKYVFSLHVKNFVIKNEVVHMYQLNCIPLSEDKNIDNPNDIINANIYNRYLRQSILKHFTKKMLLPSTRNSGFEALWELTCGLRSEARNNSSELGAEAEWAGLAIENEYNLQEFQVEYVIKPYSKDDVHKYIKYDVWSSTLNGNKKLDAAFRDSDAKTSETGVKCHVFLFFLVNGSGQFVGVAEMIGKCNESRTEDAPSTGLLSSNPISIGKRGEVGPTLVLVVRRLDENVDEEMLRYEFSNRAPIKDLRLVRDKFTRAKRLCIRAFLLNFLILFFMEALFYCGVAVFLFLIDRLNKPKHARISRNIVPHVGYQVSSVAVLVLNIIIPTMDPNVLTVKVKCRFDDNTRNGELIESNRDILVVPLVKRPKDPQLYTLQDNKYLLGGKFNDADRKSVMRIIRDLVEEAGLENSDKILLGVMGQLLIVFDTYYMDAVDINHSDDCININVTLNDEAIELSILAMFWEQLLKFHANLDEEKQLVKHLAIMDSLLALEWALVEDGQSDLNKIVLGSLTDTDQYVDMNSTDVVMNPYFIVQWIPNHVALNDEVIGLSIPAMFEKQLLKFQANIMQKLVEVEENGGQDKSLLLLFFTFIKFSKKGKAEVIWYKRNDCSGYSVLRGVFVNCFQSSVLPGVFCTGFQLSSRLGWFDKRQLKESSEYIKDVIKPCQLMHGRPTVLNTLSKRRFILFATSEDEQSFSELEEPDDFEPEEEGSLAENNTFGNISFDHAEQARGKPGIISFYGSTMKIEEQVPVTSQNNKLLWLVGPTVLVASFVFPSLYLWRILSSIFEDSLVTVSVFLLLIDRLNRPKKKPKHAEISRDIVPHMGYRVSSVAVLVLSIIIPTMTMGFVWPWTGPAASATLAPYLVGIVVQFAFEQYAKYVDSPSWPAIPIVFQCKKVAADEMVELSILALFDDLMLKFHDELEKSHLLPMFI